VKAACAWRGRPGRTNAWPHHALRGEVWDEELRSPPIFYLPLEFREALCAVTSLKPWAVPV